MKFLTWVNAFLLSAAILASCQMQIPTLRGEGEVSITLTDSTRILVPNISLSPASYNLTFDLAGHKTQHTLPSSAPSGTFTLPAGLYTLTVDALNSSSLVLARGSSSVQVQPGKTAEAFVTLDRLIGNGSFKLEAKVEGLGLTAPVLTATLKAMEGPQTFPLTFLQNQGLYTAQRADLPSGYYSLDFNLKDTAAATDTTGVEWPLILAGTETYGGVTLYKDAQGKLLASITLNPPKVVADSLAFQTPVIGFSPAKTSYKTNEALTVSLSSETGAEIRYTTDGTEPTATSSLYSTPFSAQTAVAGLFRIKAKAFPAAGTTRPASSTADKVYAVEGILDGLVLYVYGYTHVHHWNALPAGAASSTTWPGNPMTPVEGKPGWYKYTIAGITSTNLIFNSNGAGQTKDLTGILAGERWYKDGAWIEPVIDDSENPTVDFTSPAAGTTLTGSVSLSVSALDNIGVASVEFFNGELSLGKVTAAPWTLVWNSAYTSNGSKVLKAVARDRAGNTAEDTLAVSTQNANLPPLANAGPDITVVKGGTVFFNAGLSSDPNGTITSYTWSNGLTGKTAQKVYDTEGAFPVTLMVTDNDGATATDTLTVNVVKQLARTDMREESVYFILPARFYDGDATNNRYSNADKNSGNLAGGDPSWRGDFKGLIQKLDYIKAMGFSAIWITPPVLNRSDMDYHGYHAWDMTKVDPRLESPGATYQDFINAAHSKGIKIIQDIVINHSSKYGEKNFGGRVLWGDDADPDWGATSKGGKANYYDVYNPNFEYDGISIEPISGKSNYNGDTWTKTKPVLPWDPANPIQGWGTKTQWRSPEGWAIWNYQWSEYAYGLLNPTYYHTTSLLNWEDYTCQIGTIHPDCVDLNTESSAVQQYLIDTYNKYIDMGVDGFRIDTAKHVSRVMFNRHYLPAWKIRGGENFYMVGEVLTKIYEVWNKGVAPLSAPFYTWKERKTYSADDVLAAKEGYDYENAQGTGSQPTSQNAFLNGNDYRPVDYSQKSGMDVIDCRMHVNFADASAAFNVKDDDKYYNDATWNMTYVDSHDYGPSTSENRFAGGTDTWAENFSLMFTFRGIPTVYYGSEIEFKAGLPLGFDPNKLPLENSGRAYYGSQIEGSVTATGFGTWTGATGALADTMEKPLVKQLARLNQIRRAVPALQKGQYSTEGCSGNIAFKRRFTSATVDSFALVAVSGGATFSGIPNGTYQDAVTGAVKTVTGGTLTSDSIGKGNIRVWVLSTAKTAAPGKVGTDTNWIK